MESKVLFAAEHISKQFVGTLALDDVSIDIRSGEVLGLIGENGAGKSTLFKIITGYRKPTCGNMQMRGKVYNPANVGEANRQGVGMVFQEQSLVTNLTVAENIFFGAEGKFRRIGPLLDRKRLNKAALHVLDSFELEDIDPATPVAELNFARRQMVEIAKVLNTVQSAETEAALILLDEPTSMLTNVEIEQLFKKIRRITAKGHAVVFVSHRLDEVLSICDRVYVFKDGCNMGAFSRNEVDEDRLYKLMVGRAGSGEYYQTDRQHAFCHRGFDMECLDCKGCDNIVLRAQNLGLKGRFKNISFNLCKGQILTICGVVGSGKEALCSVLMGDEAPTSGYIWIKGRKVTFKDPADALENGIITIPKERNEEGIVGILSVLENITLSNLDRLKTLGLIIPDKQKALAAHWIDKLRIKCPGMNITAQSLSGGNAQKVVFSRILASGADVFILNHPTRGVDVGAKEDLYGLVREITKAGKSCLLLADTLDEAIGLSNTITVMKDGMQTRTIPAPAKCKPDQVEVVKYMM